MTLGAERFAIYSEIKKQLIIVLDTRTKSSGVRDLRFELLFVVRRLRFSKRCLFRYDRDSF